MKIQKFVARAEMNDYVVESFNELTKNYEVIERGFLTLLEAQERARCLNEDHKADCKIVNAK